MLVFCIERSYWWSLYLRILRKGQQQKTINLLVFFLWLVKSVNNRLVDHLVKCHFFLISSLVYGLSKKNKTAILLDDFDIEIK